MLVLVLVLIFLLGWPFEWPAIVLVFLPIFYPVVAAMKIDLVWFGALVAVVLQTAFLSPPVAMSAYYLKQVVQGLEPRDHLRRHVPVHDHPGDLHRPAGRVPEDRHLVSGDAAGERAGASNSCGTPEDH